MRRTIFTILALAFVLQASPAIAGYQRVIRDCTDDGRLEGHYTQTELRNALDKLPSDVTEYTNCAGVIRAAQLNGGGGSGGGTAGGGPTGSGGATSAPVTGALSGDFGGFSGYAADPLSTTSKDEKAAIAAAQQGPTPPLLLDGRSVVPGRIARRTITAGSVIPAPLIAVLALLGGAVLTLTTLDLRRRVLARRFA